MNVIEEKVYGDTEGYQLVIPRMNISNANAVTLSNDLDGDEDVQYKLKFNITYTMTTQKYLRFLINGAAPTGVVTATSWFGYWLGNVTPTSEYTGSYLLLARPHGGTASLKGWALLDALSGDGIRNLESYYNIRDISSGNLRCHSAGWWDNTTTKITELGLQFYNGGTFSGWVELYKLKKNWSEL